MGKIKNMDSKETNTVTFSPFGVDGKEKAKTSQAVVLVL
jgi:hypothetical protein